MQTGETFEEETDVLISARGNLNEIVWPKIPGIDSFEGEIMHSAAWNQKSVHALNGEENRLMSLDMTLRTRRSESLAADRAQYRLFPTSRRSRVFR